MAVVIRLCKHCSRPFQSKTQRAVYCSPTCNASYHMQKRRKLVNLETMNPPEREDTKLIDALQTSLT